MLLAFGMCAAIISARQTGAGQVIDAAMVDGAASLMTMTYTLMSAGIWKDQRGTNLLDTGAHFYEVYETSDGGYFALGAIEPQFYAELLRRLGLDGEELPDQMDREAWPADEGALRRPVRHQDPQGVGGHLRGQRRLCRPRALPGGGAGPPPHGGPGDVHRGGRRGPAGALPRGSWARRAPSGDRRPTPVSTATRPWPTGASRPPRWPICGAQGRSTSWRPTDGLPGRPPGFARSRPATGVGGRSWCPVSASQARPRARSGASTYR